MADKTGRAMNGTIKFLLKMAVLVLAGWFLQDVAVGQNTSDHHAEVQSGDEIILSPAADFNAIRNFGPESYSSLSGLFFGNRMIGFETSYRQPEARADLSFSIAALYGVSEADSQDNNLLIGGVSIGKTIPFSGNKRSRGNQKAELYFRILPGVSFAMRGLIDRGAIQFYPGIMATTEFGGIYHLTDRVSFFTHAGGRFYWSPGLVEMGIWSRPAVMIGLQINFTGGFSMVQF